MATPRENFIRALRRQPVQGHVPHFELEFFLTMESLGKVHHSQRTYRQWQQMSDSERALHIDDLTDVFIAVAEKYHHSAIFMFPNPGTFENAIRTLEVMREKTGDKYFLMLYNDPTFSIPDGNHMMDFSVRMYEEADALKEEAKRNLEAGIAYVQRLSKYPGLVDGFGMCSDYSFNVNPFFSPEQFAEFVTPYLKEMIAVQRELGYYSIKHTDGNIMPILGQIADCRPDALHSIDPQGGMNLSDVGRQVGNEMALIGNVNCGLMQTGTDAQCAADVRRALREGMQFPGYIFSTSNCAYTGMPLARYEMMHDIWRAEGVYAEPE